MFSGIVEEFATVVAIQKDRDNIDFTLEEDYRVTRNG